MVHIFPKFTKDMCKKKFKKGLFLDLVFINWFIYFWKAYHKSFPTKRVLKVFFLQFQFFFNYSHPYKYFGCKKNFLGIIIILKNRLKKNIFKFFNFKEKKFFFSKIDIEGHFQNLILHLEKKKKKFKNFIFLPYKSGFWFRSKFLKNRIKLPKTLF